MGLILRSIQSKKMFGGFFNGENQKYTWRFESRPIFFVWSWDRSKNYINWCSKLSSFINLLVISLKFAQFKQLWQKKSFMKEIHVHVYSMSPGSIVCRIRGSMNIMILNSVWCNPFECNLNWIKFNQEINFNLLVFTSLLFKFEKIK